MEHLIRSAESQLARLKVPLTVRLPGGRVVGPQRADVTMEFSRWPAVALLATGAIGKIAEGIVEDRIRIDGTMRNVMDIASRLLPTSPVPEHAPWWTRVVRRLRSAAVHSIERDAAQVQFHYDVSDDFYALWLDPKRVYSCAYFAQPSLTLAQAQEAKLDHICRKLMLRPGERFLDIGAGWGGLLLWAAEHYGVDATGITLSKNQHAHVSRLIRDKGLGARVRVMLCDYRDMAAPVPFDKIASVGMIEHVGQANLGAYFHKIVDLLAPGGLVLNHGITAASPEAGQLGAGIGDFIEKYIFPGGELLHVSQLLREGSAAGLEMLDTENLRPHYARTLWAWSDRLESQLGQALVALRANGSTQAQAERVLRAYRLYLAGSAMSFERGWMSLHQMLAARPAQADGFDNPPGAQSRYPFTREYMYPCTGVESDTVLPDGAHTRESCKTMLYKFKSKAAGDVIMLQANGEQILRIIGKEPGPKGIVLPEQMPAAIAALEKAIAQGQAAQSPTQQQSDAKDDDVAAADRVNLSQRAAPFIDMLRRCHAADKEIVWGV